MGSYLQILALIIVGVVLLWLGYSLLIGQFAALRIAWQARFSRKRLDKFGVPGDPQICPVCSTRLNKGELVSSHAFPSLSGGRDRLMHIQGCYYCLKGKHSRCCPVCGNFLGYNEYLIARMFERPNHRTHVHVLGCSRCKRG